MRILFIGDIFGACGRRILAGHLKSLLTTESIDLCIANGENVVGGRGLNRQNLRKLYKYGVHLVTGGNHIFKQQDFATDLNTDPNVIRPFNYPSGTAGKGYTIFTLGDGRNVGVINLEGRIYNSNTHLTCPFKAADEAVAALCARTKIILVDVHAEATSEKVALGWYLDGKVSAVLGTHTHIQTADETIRPNGTAYITDVGMTGPHDSVIGMKKNLIIQKFLTAEHVRFEPSESGARLNAVIIDVDDASGHAVSIRRINSSIENATSGEGPGI